MLSAHSFLSLSFMIISLALSVGGLTAGVGAVASVSAYASEPATADLARAHVPADEDLLLAHGSSLVVTGNHNARQDPRHSQSGGPGCPSWTAKRPTSAAPADIRSQSTMPSACGGRPRRDRRALLSLILLGPVEGSFTGWLERCARLAADRDVRVAVLAGNRWRAGRCPGSGPDASQAR